MKRFSIVMICLCILFSANNYTTKDVIVYEISDWVSVSKIQTDVGSKFISGGGIEYTVVAKENNFDNGGCRETIILESENGNRKVIEKFPAGQYDNYRGDYFEIVRH